MNIPASITELHADLLAKKYSVVSLVDTFLARIKKFDPHLNAFITVSEDLAYKQAKAADDLLGTLGKKAVQDYPLIGVVVAHKDLFLTKGLRTTAGSKVLTDYVPSYSATVVKKLDQAGAITIGKLNCDAWAHGSSGENSDFGPTVNPWGFDYVPGGSSSGSAAAVSAQFCMFATGTDTCGSIRLPANFTNTVGLKPTYGSVSRYGIVAMASSLDSIGHFTRNVSDAQKVYEITKGEDGNDATLKNSKEKAPKQKFTVGIPVEFFGEGLDSEIGKNIEEVIVQFKKFGVDFKEVSLPSTKYGISVYYIVQPAEVASNLGRYDGIRFGNSRDAFGSEAKRRIMLGTYVLSSGYYDAYYNKAMKVRSVIINEVNSVFDQVDCILAPVSPTPAFKLGEKVSDPLKMYLSDIYAATANLAGIPALALPSGFTKSKLPLGFQLMGPRFSEDSLFDLGELFQKNTDFHTKLPNLS